MKLNMKTRIKIFTFFPLDSLLPVLPYPKIFTFSHSFLVRKREKEKGSIATPSKIQGNSVWFLRIHLFFGLQMGQHLQPLKAFQNDRLPKVC
jgi:hypothetical protein